MTDDITAAIEEWRARPIASRVEAGLLSTVWAIRPDVLEMLYQIATRQTDGPEAIGIRTGERLEGTRRATIRDGVGILPVFGPIIPRAGSFAEMSGAVSIQTLSRDLSALRNDDAVRAILIEYDTPGGATTGVADFAREIRAATGGKPIWAYTGGYAQSAGYWLAAAADRIVMADTAVVGSIGVVAAVPVQERADMQGFRRIEVVSSNAPLKRPDLASDAGRASLLQMLDAIEAIFIDDLAGFRGVTADKVRADFGRGGSLVGASAVAAGMADSVGTFEDTLRELAASRGGSRRPGAAAAGNSNISEGRAMDLSALTLDQLRASRNDLVDQIGTSAVAAAVAAGSHTAAADVTRQVAEARDAAAAAGAAAERDRIAGILKIAGAAPAEGSPAAAAILDPKATRETVAVAMLEAGHKPGAAGLDRLRALDPAIGAGSAAEMAALDGKDGTAAAVAGVPDGADPALAAAWKANTDKCRDQFSSFERYAAFSQQHARGRVSGKF